MNFATTTHHPAPNLEPSTFDRNGCRYAAIMLTLYREGTWRPHEIIDVYDVVVLAHRGLSPETIAEHITQRSGILRTSSYVDSTLKRAARALEPIYRKYLVAS